jgi:hypothetical protein
MYSNFLLSAVFEIILLSHGGKILCITGHHRAEIVLSKLGHWTGKEERNVNFPGWVFAISMREKSTTMTITKTP